MTAGRPLALALLALAAAGCGARPGARAREYMPDMVRGPAYQAFQPNPITRDGLTLQAPVPGTVARGEVPFHYGPGEAEAVRAGEELDDPIPPTPGNLAQGRALYETYCLVCHGPQGKGDGPIAAKIPPPPSYASARVSRFPAGRLFHVVTLGSGKMPSYASQLPALDRWRIVTYVHAALQHPAGGEEGARP